MNNEIESQIASILEKAQQNIGQAVDFALEQAPLLVKEILVWNQIKEFPVLIVGIACLVISLAIWKNKQVNESLRGGFDEWGWPVKYLISTAFFFLGFLPCTLIGLFNIIKIQVAPRLFLIEYFTDLIN